jgi:hypothetical protein
MGTGCDYIDNNIRAVLLQLDLSFRLTASLCRFFGQSKKDRGTKNPAQQIPKGPVHKIPHSHILSVYGCVSINRRYFADGTARPYTVDDPLF